MCHFKYLPAMEEVQYLLTVEELPALTKKKSSQS
jgi:hypothetical protein